MQSRIKMGFKTRSKARNLSCLLLCFFDFVDFCHGQSMIQYKHVALQWREYAEEFIFLRVAGIFIKFIKVRAGI